MQLFKASRQWSSRPPDERFKSLQEIDAACREYHDSAKVATVPYGTLRVEAQDDEVILAGRTGVPARLTNWAFGQLSGRVGAPASYLRDLPATLAAQNLNYGLAHLGEEDRGREAYVLFHNGDGLLARAVTSDKYTRIWNCDVTERLVGLAESYPQWQPAPPAFDGSRGLYASDHDMFAFMVDNGRHIFEKDPNGGLSRGFFVWNSEVGASVFGVMTFLYEYCCGNHIVWGASDVRELRVRHIGDADERAFRELAGELRRYADSSASDEEAKIEQARHYRLGDTKDAILDTIFGKRIPGLSRKRLGEAYDRAEAHSDWYGDPKSAWGMVNGLTEVARDLKYADERVQLDRAAGKVMEIVF